MKNKKLTIGLATTAAFAILGLSAFALFTARDDSDFIAKAGNVNVQVDELKMSNSGNINPGDHDPDNPEDATAGTDHVFEYTVSNLGNKSIRTRHTLILTAYDDEDASVLDARFLALFNNGEEVISKTYVLEDNTEVTEITEENMVKAVKYVFIGDVFDGFGKAISEGGDAEKETLADVVKADEETNEVEKVYSYDFALLRGATNKYQGAAFNIDVIIEAMQYRNTNEEDWATVTTVSRTFSTAGIESVYVPARDEDSEGNKLSSEFLDDVTSEQPSEEVSESTEIPESTTTEVESSDVVSSEEISSEIESSETESPEDTSDNQSSEEVSEENTSSEEPTESSETISEDLNENN